MGGNTTGTTNIRDVARAAGVSVATASRVLASTNYPVAAATREKVQETARALGFVPNALARSLARARSDSIGVVAPLLVNPYYAAMVEGIDAMAREHGLCMLLSLTNSDELRRETVIDELLARQVDGVIVCAGAADHTPGRTPEAAGVPFVLIGQQANTGFPIITVDNRRAGYEATEYLWSLGHRRFAYLTGHAGWHDFKDREAGMLEFLRSRAEPHQAQVFEDLLNEADSYRCVRKAYAGGLNATALLASTDRHALGALAALADCGLRVPGNISVMGFDDYVTSEFVRPSLTTMRMPAGDMGRASVSKLQHMLSSKGKAEDARFSATLVERGSTGVAKS